MKLNGVDWDMISVWAAECRDIEEDDFTNETIEFVRQEAKRKILLELNNG